MNLTVRFGSDLVLDAISVHVSEGELVAVLGPNGCGKTTLIRALAGLLKPTTGTITMDGEPVLTAVARGSVGVAFQKPALLPWRSLIGNLTLPLEILGRSVGREEVDRVLTAVGLGEKTYDSKPGELSGGEEQRLALARLMLLSPRYLLLDEPFAAIDAITRSDLQQCLDAFRSAGKTKTAGVLVTHDKAEAVFLADRVLVMTRRPATILGAVKIDLPRPRVKATRQDRGFIEFVRSVGELLDEAGK